jgi:hypothetical protein
MPGKSNGYRADAIKGRVSAEEYAAYFDRVDAEMTDLSLLLDGKGRLPTKRIRKHLEKMIESFPVGEVGIDEPAALGVNVVASKSLSGGAHPCGGLECRVASATIGARFSALYADHILIRDPFEEVRHHKQADFDLFSNVTASIATLRTWQPLLLSGLASHSASICPSCARGYGEKHGLFSESYDQLSRALDDELAQVSVGIETEDEEVFLVFGGVNKFFGHDISHHEVSSAQERVRLRRLLKRRKRLPLSRKQIVDLDVLEHVKGPLLADAVTQAVHRHPTRHIYASNLTTDVDLARRLTASGNPEMVAAAALLAALQHSVPIINDVPISRVMALREENDASFERYRKRIAGLAGSCADIKSLRAAGEELKIEYQELDQRIRSRKRSFWGDMKDRISVAAGTVTIGTGAWLSHIISPTVVAILAAAGGLPAAQKALLEGLASRRNTEEERAAPLFFLWQMANTRLKAPAKAKRRTER